jgi:hypothetical protein
MISSDYISSSITTHGQMRTLPHQGDRHSTVDHGHTSDGVFLLLHLWVLPLSRVILLANDLPPLLSLACGRPLKRMTLSSANGGASTYLGLKDLHVQKKGAEPTPEWARPTGLGQTAQAHPGPVRSPFCPRGSSCIYAPCSLHLHHFDDVILASKLKVLLA